MQRAHRCTRLYSDMYSWDWQETQWPSCQCQTSAEKTASVISDRQAAVMSE